MTEKIYQINLSYACAGVCVIDGKISYTAPIFVWARGRRWTEFEAWVNLKRGTIQPAN